MDGSIIIPTFNRLWSLPDAVASCPHVDGIEVIVVDDGSTDGTSDWLATQPHVRAIRQPNWGKPAAANAGFAAARGRYVRFLDSDDLLVADAVVEQLRAAIAADADMSVAGYTARYEPTGTQVAHDWISCGDFLAQQLGECDSSHYSAYWFRRDFLADVHHRPDFAYRDDRMFVLECALRDPSVAVFARPTLIHRHHDRGRIQFQPGSVQVVTNWQELQMWRKVAGLLDAQGALTERRRLAIANNLWPLALRIAGHSRREGREAIRWLRELAPGFEIPRNGLGKLYRGLGFELTQPLVNGARTLRNASRDMRSLLRG